MKDWRVLVQLSRQLMARAVIIIAPVVTLAVVLTASACRERVRDTNPPAPPPVLEPAPVTAVEPPAPAETAPKPRALPPITTEPIVNIRLERSRRIALALLDGGQLADGTAVQVTRTTITAQGDGIALGSLRFAVPLVISFASHDRANFELTSHATSTERYAGDLVIDRDGDEVVVAERIGIERYLAGVLAKEIEPDWPLEALKAQAVAARSYATVRWMERHDQTWQLDSSEQVDMAYAGYLAKVHPRLALALEQTRGNLLWYAEQPLPAFFHASSGGRTCDLASVWPDRRAPDGVTRIDDAFVARFDQWATTGEEVAPQRLGTWRCVVELSDVRQRLQRYSKDIGAVGSLKIVERDAAGERAVKVAVNHSRGRTILPAHAIRMAIGSTLIRSTLWTKVAVTPSKLVIEGRGYGHGVGMPQASAWAMSRNGQLAPAILNYFYPGATLVRKW